MNYQISITENTLESVKGNQSLAYFIYTYCDAGRGTYSDMGRILACFLSDANCALVICMLVSELYDLILSAAHCLG